MASQLRVGSSVVNPKTGATVHWRPIEPVADEYETAYALGWSVLGVIGNVAHLKKTGGHTPWSTEWGAKPGWVYAIDIDVPASAAAKFEAWLLGRLRSGFYPWVAYLNILNRHWERSATKTSGNKTVSFAYSVYSGDHHLHLSGRGGYETTNSSILRDWADFQKPKPAPKPVEVDMDAADKQTLAAIRSDVADICWALGTRPGQTPEQVRDQQQSTAVAGLVSAVTALNLAVARIEAKLDAAKPAG